MTLWQRFLAMFSMPIHSPGRVICTVEGCDWTDNGDGSYSALARGRIDTDGFGSLHGDPCAQRDTSLHYEGRALNADVDLYVVMPPQVIRNTHGAVMGCQVRVENIRNGLETDAVVGDEGPATRCGEVSRVVAELLGLDPDPNHGGTDERILKFTIWPGRAAKCGGRQYVLKPA